MIMVHKYEARRMVSVFWLRAAKAVSIFAVVIAGSHALQARETKTSFQPERFEPADSLEGNYLAAIVAGSARDAGAAATFLREAIKADPRNAELLERAFIAFLADGAMPDAFRAAERLAARDPSNNLAQLALGVRALKAKQYQSARNFLQKGGRGRAADITATLLTGWAFAGAGEGTRALEAVDRLKGESSYNLFRDYHAGLIADLAGNANEAAKRLKTAFDADPATLRVVDAWGRFQARRGDKVAAREAYVAHDKLLPTNNPVIKDALAKLDAGVTPQRLVVSAQQGAAEVLYGLGSAGQRSGDELAGMIYLRLALHLDPGHEMALFTLGDVLDRVKQSDDALAIYARMPEGSPLKTTSEIQMALGLEQMKRGDEAVKLLEALSVARPGDTDVMISLGRLYQSRKDFAKAAEVFDKIIITIEPSPQRSHWNLFYARGIAFERTKQWPKAEADFRRALSLIPETNDFRRDRSLVLNYLGYSWVDKGLNLDEAFKMLRQAVDLSPRDGHIIDSLGWAFFRLGRYEDAVRELERAIELMPGDAVINDHLGDAYYRVGRKLEATFQWNHARDMNPDPEDLPRILAKIERGGLEEPVKPTTAESEPVKTDAPKPNGG
jgi:tetratricopeptide (TPR) repeat protein